MDNQSYLYIIYRKKLNYFKNNEQFLFYLIISS